MIGAIGRRTFLAGASALALPARLGAAPAASRVILDNDFAGDPDGLFQLAHHLLCPQATIPLIIGSHLPAVFAGGHSAQLSAARAQDLIDRMRLRQAPRPIAGAAGPIASRQSWRPGPASAAIIREALREDTAAPLVYAVGAGLTDLALAWLEEPRIGRRLRLVWIGGRTPPGATPVTPDPDEVEFNFSIDPVAAGIIFNESDIEIWQVPSGTYRQMLFGTGELEELGQSGPLGAWLKAQIDGVPAMLAEIPGVPPPIVTDAYVLGDSPLVTLSALVTPFGREPASSRFATLPTPQINPDGSYTARPGARPMRVYTTIDAGLTFRDMVARFHLAQARMRRSGV